MNKLKFTGPYSKLQRIIALAGINGHWRDLGNQKQYKTNDATLNFYVSNGTVFCQGPGAEELGSAVASAISQAMGAGSEHGLVKNGQKRPRSVLPDDATKPDKHQLGHDKRRKTTAARSGKSVTDEWAANTRERIGIALTCCSLLNGWEMSFLDDMERRLARPDATVSDKQMCRLLEVFHKAGM